ncbi:flagellar biosynthesis protein FlhF [Polynucleobacter paludilacus]|uniref:flagellar biosynthesis protein FlhF n=1 Tax=Polynucleobacter paludilacus TaxID=1855895 RepID=UPI001BFDCD4B|nr:flagellar biosynthesis protein FlhF [Polynucleobacter paludilacus]QWD87749.1 flagellar biosynthesis protein FlhF [Polynucleobacter paludilacus]
MTTKRFVAKTARDVMKQVRDELGADASILTHREINGWHEITATAGEADATPKEAKASGKTELENKQLQMKRAQEMLQIFNSKQNVKEASTTSETTSVKAPAVVQATSNSANQNQEMNQLLVELREMKNSFQSQLNAISWESAQHQSPNARQLTQRMLEAGFTQDLAKRVLKKLPADLALEDAIIWSRNLLSKNIQCIENEAEILDSKGVYAFLGPTGVGKTTTVAKIASRFALQHGKASVALISTDTYRIGGNEQLHIYAKILGVEMLTAKDGVELDTALEKLSKKKLVLIDMAGLSHKDKMVEKQLEMLSATQTKIKKVLCLNANNTTESLNAVTQAYSSKGIEGCIITKVDESISLGGILNAVMQNKLRVLYITNGQRVPEDIALLNKTNELEMLLSDEEDADSSMASDTANHPENSSIQPIIQTHA